MGCPKFSRSSFQKMLSGMFVPHGSAGGSAQNFLARASRKCFLGCSFLMGPPEALPKIFSLELPENAFWDVRSSWVRRRLCPKFSRSSFQKMLSGMLVPHGSAGGSAQNFLARAPRKCFLGCSFLMGPPEALPKIFSLGLPEIAFWDVLSSWARRRLPKDFFVRASR